MTLQQRQRLNLEQLEARETPDATISVRGGTLLIRGDNAENEIFVQQTGASDFDVTVNGVNQGSFTARHLVFNMGTNDDQIDLALTDSIGNLTVNLGGGNDSFSTAVSDVGAQVNGRVLINMGRTGLALEAAYDEVVELYNLTFTGPTVTVNGASGAGTQNLDLDTAQVNGTLFANNIYQIDVGDPGNAAGAVTIGHLRINNTLHNTDVRTDAPSGKGNALFMYSGSRIVGNLHYTGGYGRDDIDLPADFPDLPVDNVYIGGNVTFIGRTGVNTLAMGYGDGTGFGARIGGNVLVRGGINVDRLFFDSGSTIGGNFTAYLDGGDDQLFGDSVGQGDAGKFNPDGSASVGGNVFIDLGNGQDFIGTYTDVFTVGNNLTIRGGNGTQLGNDADVPGSVTFFNEFLEVGGRATYGADVGTQTIEIANDGSTLGNLNIFFGQGTNTVNFLVPEFSGAAFINFGRGLGTFEADATPTDFLGGLTLRGRFQNG